MGGSLSSIIDHWGDYGEALQPWAGPGHWHDMDMLLIGNDCVTIDEQRTQMAIWAISASPLIMGNDMRQVANESKNILFNTHAIAVSQDPLGQMGIRLTGNTATQVWARKMENGDVAVALYNKGATSDPADITFQFNMTGINLYGSVEVFDIWAKKSVGTHEQEFTAKSVPFHGTSFLRLSPTSSSFNIV